MTRAIEELMSNKKAFKKYKKQMKISLNYLKKKKYSHYITEAQKAVQILNQSVGIDHPLAGKIYHKIGTVYNVLDQLEKANSNLLKAKSIYETYVLNNKNNDQYKHTIKEVKKDLASIYTLLSNIALKLNNFNQLDEMNVKLVESNYAGAHEKIEALFQLAEYRKRAEQYDEAYLYAKQALELLKKASVINEQYLIRMYIIIGEASLHMGNYERTITIFNYLKNSYILSSSDINIVYTCLKEAEEKMNAI